MMIGQLSDVEKRGVNQVIGRTGFYEFKEFFRNLLFNQVVASSRN